jgi:hypothetical protein
MKELFFALSALAIFVLASSMEYHELTAGAPVAKSYQHQ